MPVGAARVFTVGVAVILAVVVWSAATVDAKPSKASKANDHISSTAGEQQTAPTQVSARSKTFKVSSRFGWQRTPLKVSRGNALRVQWDKVSDWTVDHQNFPYVGPQGYPPHIDGQIYQGCKLRAKWPYARLIGKVNQTGRLFSVGRGGKFTARKSGGFLYLRIHDANACLGDNGGSITVRVRKVSHGGTGKVALLAPFRNGTAFRVSSGYYNNQDQSANGCHIGRGPDHCRHQLFGLDLAPSQSSDRDILAPVPGKVDWITNDCLGLILADGLNLTICHFSSFNVKRGDSVPRGCVLGARSAHVHLNLSNRRVNPWLPVAFNQGHTFERRVLNPNHDGNGKTVDYANHTYKVDFNEWQGVPGTSTNKATSCT
jgi:murein DD-endopeptidase MepM/ murein hydrolase activator NlpD